MDNILQYQGDYFIVRFDGVVTNVNSIVSYTEDIVGSESLSSYLEREFRYSVDGVSYSNWSILNQQNLSSLVFSSGSLFSFEIRYTKQGNDSTKSFVFNSVDLFLQIQKIDSPLYDQSIFKPFFEETDDEVLKWAINVLNKLYGDGIVARYIEKDSDFTTFFGWLTHWWAIIVKYARCFGRFSSDSTLLQEYLKQKDLILRDVFYTQDQQSSLTISDEQNLLKLQNLLNNLNSEFLKRGTLRVIFKETNSDFEGELLRLIQYDSDDFILSLIDKFSTNFTLGKGSPLYKGSQSLTKVSKDLVFNG